MTLHRGRVHFRDRLHFRNDTTVRASFPSLLPISSRRRVSTYVPTTTARTVTDNTRTSNDETTPVHCPRLLYRVQG